MNTVRKLHDALNRKQFNGNFTRHQNKYRQHFSSFYGPRKASNILSLQKIWQCTPPKIGSLKMRAQCFVSLAYLRTFFRLTLSISRKNITANDKCVVNLFTCYFLRRDADEGEKRQLKRSWILFMLSLNLWSNSE